MAIKLGNTGINKAYLGGVEIKKLYLGANVIFDNSVNTDAFIIEVDTTKAGSASNQFQFTGAEGDYDVIAKQNNIVVATFDNLSNQETITLPSSGVYNLEIKSKKVNGFNRINFNNSGDKLKIADIKQWGDVAWSSFSSAFRGCSNMLTTATDAPNLSNVTTMSQMFRDATLVNPNTENWDVSNVIIMFRLFFGTIEATSNVSNWDVSSAEDMGEMFRNTAINPDTTNWDVSSVTNMSGMFLQALNANPNTSNWDVGSVTTMSSMFTDSNLSEENLTLIYENWSLLTLQQNVSFSAGTTKYNASGQAGRDILVNTYNWSITDGGPA